MAELGIFDRFKLRGKTLVDLRDQGPATRRRYRQDFARTVEVYPGEILCADPHLLELQKTEISQAFSPEEAATMIANLEAVHASARMPMVDHNGDFDPVDLVVRDGGYWGFWRWYGIQDRGMGPGGRQRISAHAHPVFPMVGAQFGRVVARWMRHFLKRRNFTTDGVEVSLVEIRARLYFQTRRSPSDRAVERLIESLESDARLSTVTTPMPEWAGMNMITITLA